MLVIIFFSFYFFLDFISLQIKSQCYLPQRSSLTFSEEQRQWTEGLQHVWVQCALEDHDIDLYSRLHPCLQLSIAFGTQGYLLDDHRTSKYPFHRLCVPRKDSTCIFWMAFQHMLQFLAMELSLASSWYLRHIHSSVLDEKRNFD